MQIYIIKRRELLINNCRLHLIATSVTKVNNRGTRGKRTAQCDDKMWPNLSTIAVQIQSHSWLKSLQQSWECGKPRMNTSTSQLFPFCNEREYLCPRLFSPHPKMSTIRHRAAVLMRLNLKMDEWLGGTFFMPHRRRENDCGWTNVCDCCWIYFKILLGSSHG